MKYFALEYINDKFRITGMCDDTIDVNMGDVILVNESELSMIKPELIINLDKYIQNK